MTGAEAWSASVARLLEIWRAVERPWRSPAHPASCCAALRPPRTYGEGRTPVGPRTSAPNTKCSGEGPRLPLRRRLAAVDPPQMRICIRKASYRRRAKDLRRSREHTSPLHSAPRLLNTRLELVASSIDRGGAVDASTRSVVLLGCRVGAQGSQRAYGKRCRIQLQHYTIATRVWGTTVALPRNPQSNADTPPTSPLALSPSSPPHLHVRDCKPQQCKQCMGVKRFAVQRRWRGPRLVL